MSFASIILLVVLAGALLTVPRQRAPLMLLIGASYVTLAQEVTVGPFHFTFIRILVAVGFLRVATKGERLAGGFIITDRLMLLWGFWLVASSAFHEDPGQTLVTRLGIAYDGLGLYFLFRIFVQNFDDVLAISRFVILVLIPIACAMVVESMTGRNSFYVFNGAATFSEFRKGHFRAQGPFAGAIMAGTVGAACLPLALLFWHRNRKLAIWGLAATAVMVITSRSSGPLMTAAAILFALGLWKIKENIQAVRWSIILGVIVLALAMNDPVYYVIAKIDLTGGSTGYHRAALIQACINHFNEWWMTGTDYTRHWMPTGIEWNSKHTDITNHYIKEGVLGGLPLMLLFIGMLVSSFAIVSKALKSSRSEPEQQFMVWTLGSILFGHVVTFFSVSYWDQSIVFLYLSLALIGSLPFAMAIRLKSRKVATATRSAPQYEPSFSRNR
jgi:hypothetical protein